MNRLLPVVALTLGFAVSACGNGGTGQAPSSLTYSATAAVYTAGVAISPNQPVTTGGAPERYSISPALPAGLSIAGDTGVISGTPAATSVAVTYLVTATNGGGNASTNLSIAVQRPAAPLIVAAPVTQVVAVDQRVTFSVAATGTGPLAYQWYKAGVALAGETGTSTTTGPVVLGDDDAAYTVVISDNFGGSTTSGPAKIRLQGFIATGSMLTGRQSLAMTRLVNGTVLVTGGIGSSPLRSAELYDPVTGTFSATGGMLDARQDHTSTLLGNGKVLVIGGEGGAGGGTPLLTSELYDPASATFAPSGSMATPRTAHAATVLADGRVLVTGGQWNTAATSILQTAALYDPATGTFTATGSMTVGRYWHTSTLLPGGLVLITGGYGLTGAGLASAELYDPSSGLFTATGDMTSPRYGHSATPLTADGLVLVVGGVGTDLLASAELYDPVSGTFQSTGALNTARQFHSATALPGGKVLVAGGLSSSAPLASAELYDPVLGTFTTTASMVVARHDHAAELLDSGEVLMAGGWVIGGTGLSDAELFSGAP
jgi:hypothetical protein